MPLPAITSRWEDTVPLRGRYRRQGGGTAAGTTEANEVKAQNGNPAFLDKVYDGIRLEARITGTEAPQKQTLDGELRLPIRVIDEIYTDPHD